MDQYYDDATEPALIEMKLKLYTETEWIAAAGSWLSMIGTFEYQHEFETCCRRIRLLKRRKYPKTIRNIYEVVQKTTASVFWNKYELFSQLKTYEMYGRILMEALIHIEPSVELCQLRRKIIFQMIKYLSRLQVFFVSSDNRLSYTCLKFLDNMSLGLQDDELEGRFGTGIRTSPYIASKQLARVAGLCPDSDVGHAYLCTFHINDLVKSTGMYSCQPSISFLF